MKRFIFSFVLASLIVFIASNAFAYGIGAYVTGGGGFNFGWGNYMQTKYPITNIGGGLLFDSNVSGEGFNYRLNIGIDQWKDTVSNKITVWRGGQQWDYTKTHSNKTNISRVHILNNFGFDLSNSSNVRIWFGPQVGFGFGIRNADLRLFTASLGPVLGTSFLLNENVILSFDISINCLFIMKHYLFEDAFMGLVAIGGGPIVPIRKYNRDYDGALTGNLNISVLYRIGH